MDTALYLLGPTGPSNYAELKLSLRSIHTNLVGLERVIIVGARPSWLTDAAEYLPYRQAKHDWGNQIRLLQHACQHSDVPNEFLLMHDDYHCRRPVHIDDVKPMHNGTLVDLLDRYRAGYYHRATKRTLEMLAVAGYPDPLSYDGLHVPLPTAKTGMAHALQGVDPPAQYKTLYGVLTSIGGVPGRDAKGQSASGTWTSTSTASGMAWARLRRAFTTPSPYEAT